MRVDQPLLSSQHIRLYFRVGLKARFGPPVGEAAVMQGSGGGVVSNSWFWAAVSRLGTAEGAYVQSAVLSSFMRELALRVLYTSRVRSLPLQDHNLTDMQGMGCGAPNCTSHRPVGQSLGEQVSDARGAARWHTLRYCQAHSPTHRSLRKGPSSLSVRTLSTPECASMTSLARPMS